LRFWQHAFRRIFAGTPKAGDATYNEVPKHPSLSSWSSNGYGLAKAMSLAADVLGRPNQDLIREVDQFVADIDPNN
jgi:hypothetical protein